jgi:hypothetical protein
VKRIALLATAASVYVLAAWAVAPGFYDFSAPPPTYNWVCPPAQFASGNLPPRTGHADITVTNGMSDPSSAVTDDGQLAIGFPAGVFDAAGKATILVDIVPVSPCPNPPGIYLATNAYQITATALLTRSANLRLVYAGNIPSPSDVYYASAADGTWTSIGSAATAQQYTIDTTTRQFGFFAAGYPANATRSGTASQLLPIAVAVLIVAVLIAGIPLALVRRRQAAGGVEDSEETDDN